MDISRLRHKMSLHLIKYLRRVAIISLLPILGFSSLAVTPVDLRAATSPVSINMVYYGSHSATIDDAIINANPEFLIGTSPIGPAGGDADINKFTTAGIKYLEYLTGGYETKFPKGLPVDLQSNLAYIDAIAAAGAYGVFFDEVSDGIWTAPDYNYLQQISSRAHSLGLKVVFNIGVNNWIDQLMNYCDYIGSTEQWANAPLTASQQKWASRMWLLRRDGVNDAVTAANLTIGAWDKGVRAAYVTSNLIALPSWLPEYISLISPHSPNPAEPPPPSGTLPGNTSAVVASFPVSSGGVNEYNLAITITTTTVPGLSAGQTIWVAATTTDFPNLLVFNSDVTGDLDNSFGWWTLKKSGAVSPPPPPPPSGTGNTTGTVATVPTPSGGANEYNLYLNIISTTVPGLVAGQQVLCAASTTDFPNLLTVGTTQSGTLDNSLGWWTFKSGVSPPPPPPPAAGNTTGTVATLPTPSGGANEYNLYLNITSTTVPGLVAGQQLLCAANTTDFPNLLTVGATLTGTLDNSLGWWVFKKAN